MLDFRSLEIYFDVLSDVVFLLKVSISPESGDNLKQKLAFHLDETAASAPEGKRPTGK